MPGRCYGCRKTRYTSSHMLLAHSTRRGQETPVFIVSFRGLLDEELANTPTALDIFTRLGVALRPTPLATLVVTLLYESIRRERASRNAVCYNLLCRCAWLVPPCLRWPSRPHDALSAFFTQYIPPRVVVTRVVGPNSLFSPSPSAQISMSSFHFFQNRCLKL